MLKPILDLLSITEDRAEELFLLFLDEGQQRIDKVMDAVIESDILFEEKIFMSYLLGFMVSVQVEEIKPPKLLKTKQYVH